MQVCLDEAHRAIDSEATRSSGSEPKRRAGQTGPDHSAAGSREVEAHLPGPATHLDDRRLTGDGAIEHQRKFTPLRPRAEPLQTVARRVRGKGQLFVELADAVRSRIHIGPNIRNAIRLAERPRA